MGPTREPFAADHPYVALRGRKRPKIGRARYSLYKRMEWLSKRCASFDASERARGARFLVLFTELRAIAHVLDVFDKVHPPVPGEWDGNIEEREGFLSSVEGLDLWSIQRSFGYHCEYLELEIEHRQAIGERTGVMVDELRALTFALEVFEAFRSERERGQEQREQGFNQEQGSGGENQVD